MSHRVAVPTTSPFSLPMVRILCAWCAGIALGWLTGWIWAWLVVGVCGIAFAGLALRSGRPPVVTVPLVLVGIVALGATWWGVRHAYAPEQDLSRYVQREATLMDVSGVIEGEPYHRIKPRGQMARFMYAPPSTTFMVKVDQWHGNEASVTMRGRALVHLPRYDDRMREGDRVRVQGWLRAIDPPLNPGEYDFARAMHRLGVNGQIHLKARGNWQLVESADQAAGVFTAWRLRLVARVRSALHDGLADRGNEQAQALLDALLLGRRTAALGDLGDAFRKTGLAHLLSISGLHVGILAAGAWFVVSLLTGRPRWPAVAAIVVVVLYLLIVPWRVPLMRAAFMTCVFSWAMASGRRTSALSAMSMVGLILLIWRPADLFAPGFQLSFGIVTALILFTGRVARWISRRSVVDDPFESPQHPIVRWFMDYLAVSIVAFLTALPLVAYHFHLVSPLAIVMSVIMLPVVAGLLWLGFAKVVFSLVWSALGVWLAQPLSWLAEWCVSSVRGGSHLPGAWFSVPAPSPHWTIVAMLIMLALLGGWFAQRRMTLLLVVLISGTWLMWPSITTHAAVSGQPALRLNMIALGDGSCYVLRSGGAVAMFDCGTSSYSGAGDRTIVPALCALGVRHIDTLFISHADLDHLSETLEVVDAMRTQRIVTTAQLLEEAGLKPWSATGQLIKQLRWRGIRIETAARGWSDTLGHAHIEALAPPPDRLFDRNNDSSLVLSIHVAGKHVLLCGDAAEESLGALLDSDDELRADVLELPHHGSFIDVSPAWLRRVDPQIVLQSTGSRRLRWDKWPPYLGRATRYVSMWHGMTEVAIFANGQITSQTFRSPENDDDPMPHPDVE